MKTYRRSPMRNILTATVVVLTAVMLFLAAFYVGVTQFSRGGSAISLDKMPSGNVSVGSSYTESTPLYEKGLLPISYAAIVFGGRGGGVHGSGDAAKAILDFGSEPIHTSLSSGAVFSEIDENEFLAASYGDYLFLDFLSPLPYQIIYAMTGEYTAAARSEVAINIDRVILSFPKNDSATLFFSDGEHFYTSDKLSGISHFEALALAGDSRLDAFTLNACGVPTSTATPMLSQLSAFIPASLSNDEIESLFTLFGYDESRPHLTEAVAPHGTMQITDVGLIFGGATEGGIHVSDFLPSPKNSLDITMYDILLGGVSLTESITRSAGGLLSGATPFLKGFYRDADVYTVVFGVAVDSVEISGETYPFFAKITVSGGRFTDVAINFLSVERVGHPLPVFHSQWQYAHAKESANPITLRLGYNLSLLPTRELSPAWYFTEKTENGGEAN